MKIVAAAIRVEGQILTAPAPARHADLIFGPVGRVLFTPETPVLPSQQGFLTDTGRFANRRSAKRIALKAGQLLPMHSPGPELYSEDVW